MAAFRPDIVIHMAAQPLVRLSYAEPVETYATNVMGTVNLLEAVRCSLTTQVVVVVTSDKCYENQPVPGGYREDDRLGGHDPYAASKACAELVTSAYRRSWFEHGGPATVTARAGNVIGGGTGRVIASFLTSSSPSPRANPRSFAIHLAFDRGSMCWTRLRVTFSWPNERASLAASSIRRGTSAQAPDRCGPCPNWRTRSADNGATARNGDTTQPPKSMSRFYSRSTPRRLGRR